MSQFVRRSMAVRQTSAEPFSVPEVSGTQGLNALLWSAYMQGGDLIHLGPYTYVIKEPITIPDYCTLVGVPHRTRLLKTHTAGDTAASTWGPIVNIKKGARLVNCKLELELGGDLMFTNTAASRRSVPVTDATSVDTIGTYGYSSGVSTTLTASENAMVTLDGDNARVEGCFFVETKARAVYVKADYGIVIGNEIEHDQTTSNECIYLEDSVGGCVITSNWCRDASSGSISHQGSTTNEISANLANGIVR